MLKVILPKSMWGLFLFGLAISNSSFSFEMQDVNQSKLSSDNRSVSKLLSTRDTLHASHTLPKKDNKVLNPIASKKGMGIHGIVVDFETLEPLAGVSISLGHNNKLISSNQDGVFELPVDKAGTYQLEVKAIGYETELTEVVIENENWKTVTIALIHAHTVLDEVVISRRRTQISELDLLVERKNASLMVEKIGAEELSRKGVGDAASAISKLSGVSRQEGSTQVYVRGLGDRYNKTSLNGLPIPSSNPDLKNIALDIFSTDVVDYIAVDKVHHASLKGDFGGAHVDISSKKYTGDKLFTVQLGSTVNTNALKRAGSFKLQDGPSYFGFSNANIPPDAQGSYHFSNSWDRAPKQIIPVDIGLKYGQSFRLGEEGRLSLFSTANFSNNYTFREGINANVGAQGDRLKSFEQTRFNYTSRSTGMLNAHYQINNKHHVAYNFLYINAGDQYSDDYRGFIRDAAEDGSGIVRRNTFTQTQLIINQLLGKHNLADKIQLDWGLAANVVDGDMPDRMQHQLRQNGNGDYVFIRVNEADNHRYTYFLKEKEYAGNLSLTYQLGSEGKGNIRAGYHGTIKDRSFDVMQLNFNILPDYRQTIIDPDQIDQHLGAAGFGTFYQLKGFAGNSFQYYNGNQQIHALYARADYNLTSKLTAVVGARFEKINQEVDFYSIEFPKGENSIKKDAFLPSLNLKYALNEKQQLRFGASKTYTLPQFKERARFPYDDVTEVIIGNPYLYASDNYNLDFKWEMFPQDAELLSVAAFGKYIQNPINEIMIASATNDISFANTGDKGYVYGIELELKKDIVRWEEDRLQFGLNTSLMQTDQKFDAEKVTTETQGMVNIDPTHMRSKFSGASDFILNADLSYHRNLENNRNLMTTLLYHYASDKIYAIGTGGLGHRVDKGVGTLDFIVKSKITPRINLELAARNILNPSFERWQENAQPVKVLSYKKGQFFKVGIQYNL